MRLLFLLPLLFTLTLASEVQVGPEVIINALKKLEGTKINLPEELVEKLNLANENDDFR